MRFDVGHTPYLICFALPLLISLLQLNIVFALTLMLVLGMARFPLDFKWRRVVDERTNLVLESISGSPFVEKVRFVMDAAEINYEKEQDLGLIVSLITSRKVPSLKVPSKMLRVAESCDIIRYLRGLFCGDAEKSAFFAPIPAFSHLEPRMDNYALNLRSFVLRAIIESPDSNHVLFKYFGYNNRPQNAVPWWQHFLMALAQPWLKWLVWVKFELHKNSTLGYLDEIHVFLREMDQLLSDERQYLSGNSTLNYMDVVFAALASLQALPREAEHIEFGLEELPQIYRDEVLRFRETRAGKFVLRMYKEHRKCGHEVETRRTKEDDDLKRD